MAGKRQCIRDVTCILHISVPLKSLKAMRADKDLTDSFERYILMLIDTPYYGHVREINRQLVFECYYSEISRDSHENVALRLAIRKPVHTDCEIYCEYGPRCAKTHIIKIVEQLFEMHGIRKAKMR